MLTVYYNLNKLLVILNRSVAQTKAQARQGFRRINQLLRFHQGAVEDGPQGEEEVVRDEGADVLVAHEAVLLVEARLPAS